MSGNIAARAVLLIAALAFLVSAASANTLPTANAGPDQTAYLGDTVTFSGASSSDPDGTITGYYWDFADGTNGTGVSPTHVYSAVGSFNVTLTVIDNQGGIAQDTIVINVKSADVTPPTITHSATTSATAGSDVTLTATITDTNGINSATLYYRVGTSGNYTQISMSSSGDSYSATIPKESVTTAGVQYYIEAKDKSSNSNVARSPSTAPTTPTTITVTAADSTPPSITHSPVTSATASTNITINATITDTSGIDSATLYYRVGSSGNYTQSTMSSTGDIYSATIPKASVTTSGIQYYILAMDEASSKNTAYSPSTAPTTPNSVTVSAGTISINHTAVTSATASNAISITATITGSVQSAQLYYKVSTADSWTNSTMTNSSTTYSASIPASSVAYDGVKYYLKVTDSQGSSTYSPSGAPVTVNTVAVNPPEDDGFPNYASGTITIDGIAAPAGTSYRITVTSGTNSGYYYTGTVDDSSVPTSKRGLGMYYTPVKAGFSSGASFRVSVTGYSQNATGTFSSAVSNTVLNLTLGSAAGGNISSLSIAWNSNGSVILSWNGTASSYDIYITANYSAGFGSTPTVTVTGSSWTDSNASSYSQRYYRVAPNGSTPFNQTVGKFDLVLISGMNLVSLPLIPANYTIENIIRQNSSFYPVTEIFERLPNGDYRRSEIQVNWPNPGDISWYSADETFTNLSLDKGYWLTVSQNYNMTIVGTVPSENRSVTLNNGMNLVGWSSVNTKNLLIAIPQNASAYNVTEVFERLPNGDYRRSEIQVNWPNPGDVSWYSADESFDSLQPGKGYWFTVSGSYTWRYSP